MPVQPIDLTAIIATIMGISIVLIPVIGLTARFALKPLAESVGHFFQSKNVEESVRILERRMALLEQQLESMDTTLQRVAEASDFHRELRSGVGAAPQLGGGVPPARPGGGPGSGAPPGDTRS